IRLRLGDVLVQSTRIDDGLENLRLALATYERLRHAEGQARAHRQIASAYQGRYRDFGLALPHLEAALQMWPTEREDAEYVRLLVDTARAKVFSHDPVAGATLAQKALHVAERLDDAALLARALIE